MVIGIDPVHVALLENPSPRTSPDELYVNVPVTPLALTVPVNVTVELIVTAAPSMVWLSRNSCVKRTVPADPSTGAE